MYYLYHIPGKKIGVTSNLNTRVTLIQGYKEGEYEVLDSSDDIDYISDKEIELQKSYGYKVDMRKYNELIKKSNKMKINATEQTSTFPYPVDKLKENLLSNKNLKWKTEHGSFELTDNVIEWITRNVKVSMFNEDRSYVYNKALSEHLTTKTDNANGIFNLIRSWAKTRGIFDKGNSHTQYVKLMEEAGELAQALLKNDRPEIKDAIGDMVVVLTNLAHLENFAIEDCVESAYIEIVNRKGKMVNGTFVKNEN
jgi:NTP pyrophosphatase (non-canonical NTP hydrolase)|tara:strand:+ start:326 stop:1084 length:759 start_codon:yes stop_codon:yes gene_type:complete